jgi:hypothetical protein
MSADLGNSYWMLNYGIAIEESYNKQPNLSKSIDDISCQQI